MNRMNKWISTRAHSTESYISDVNLQSMSSVTKNCTQQPDFNDDVVRMRTIASSVLTDILFRYLVLMQVTWLKTLSTAAFDTGQERQANAYMANSLYGLSPSTFSYLNIPVQNNVQSSGTLLSKTDSSAQTCIKIFLYCCSNTSCSPSKRWRKGRCSNGKRAICDNTFDG